MHHHRPFPDDVPDDDSSAIAGDSEHLTETVHVGVCILTFHLPGARSLKDRRRHLTSFKERLRSQYNVSAAEVGDSSHWQTGTLAVVGVSNDHETIDTLLQRIIHQAECHPDIQLTAAHLEYR